MRTNEFAVGVIEERGTHWLIRLMTFPSRAIDDLFYQANKFVCLWIVAYYFNIDMRSAEALLEFYYGKSPIWIEEGEEEEIESPVHPPLDPKFIEETTYTIPFDYGDESYNQESKDADLERAMDVFIDFCLAIFEEDNMMNEDGVLTKGVIAPWAKRGELPSLVKERIKMIVSRTQPPIFFQNQSNLWQFNIVDYPTKEEAKAAISNVYGTWEK